MRLPQYFDTPIDRDALEEVHEDLLNTGMVTTCSVSSINHADPNFSSENWRYNHMGGLAVPAFNFHIQAIVKDPGKGDAAIARVLNGYISAGDPELLPLRNIFNESAWNNESSKVSASIFFKTSIAYAARRCQEPPASNPFTILENELAAQLMPHDPLDTLVEVLANRVAKEQQNDTLEPEYQWIVGGDRCIKWHTRMVIDPLDRYKELYELKEKDVPKAAAWLLIRAGAPAERLARL